MAGKGDAVRPRLIPAKEWENNWELAFKKKSKKSTGKSADACNEPVNKESKPKK